MAHSVSGYVLYFSMWFNTKFVRVPVCLGFLFGITSKFKDFFLFQAQSQEGHLTFQR